MYAKVVIGLWLRKLLKKVQGSAVSKISIILKCRSNIGFSRSSGVSIKEYAVMWLTSGEEVEGQAMWEHRA